MHEFLQFGSNFDSLSREFQQTFDHALNLIKRVVFGRRVCFKRRMRGGKDEKMQLDPLFPRLHVNSNTDKEGPRAPPRNKMALCGQVNTPSQRFSSRSLPMQPLPSSNSANLFPLASLSHVSWTLKQNFSSLL